MDRFQHFSLSVFSITRYWTKIATEVMGQYDLKGSYALYLLALINAEEELTAARLTEITQRDKADVSRAIAVFQKKEIVEPYGENRYRAPIRLTAKGQELALKIRQKSTEALQEASKGLDEDMSENLGKALDIIVENLREIYEG